ncbi:AMMECR1 domain-containing protein [bacterium]|nr:AMMECR1 domain-containing protein [bacterium]|tara:strand:- start:2555 stop:3070 length:516 start_codon:yes stop_codon:yes gene_type:complete
MKALLHLARESINEELDQQTTVILEPYQKQFNQIRSVFITLYKNKTLRGCIGQLESQNPLFKNVYDMSKKAAFADPRFDPVTLQEVSQILIEISILSPLKTIQTIDEIELGTHGLRLHVSDRSSVFLPQVAIEQRWKKKELLEQLSKKAGIQKEGWKKGTIDIFTTEKIEE